MTWITWRRYRGRIILLALYVVALVIFMILTEHGYQSAIHGPLVTLQQQNALGSAKNDGTYVDAAIALFPLLVGQSLGTPIVASEFEAKTNRLAWFQGKTRTRWLVGTWATLALLTLGLSTLLVLVCRWWVLHTVTGAAEGGGFIQPMQLTITGIAPVALALFSLTFGMFIGLVVRRVLSPYAISGLSLVAILITVPTEILSRLTARVAVSLSHGLDLLPKSLGPDPWYVGAGYQRIPGVFVSPHAPSVSTVVDLCNREIGSKSFARCFSTHGVQLVSFFQPESHYWTLQLREAGIYVALSGTLLALSVHFLRRWRA